MDEILNLATKLGKLIKADPRAARMATARDVLSASESDCQLMGDYQEAQLKMHELEATGSPIEPDDKRRFATLHEQVIASEVLKELLKAQVDYAELMNGVSRRIEEEAVPQPPKA
jgi:cell fate (sporulation/competence/biofilm development) regulator YlbF (YheA/YmcA/DUF963 family)